LTLLAKNQQGVDTLMRLVSETNRPDFFYRKPRINLARLADFASDGNLLCLSGCLAGILSSSLFTDLDAACKVSTQTESLDQVRALLKPDWMDRAAQIIADYQNAFGKENYFLEIQDEGMAVQRVVVECLRKIGESLDIPRVATLDAHYCRPEDAVDQRILLYSQLHTTQEEQERLKAEGGDSMAFFHLDRFHIFTPQEMAQHYEPHEIARTLEIADRCGALKLGRKPCLPKFSNEETQDTGKDSNAYLRELVIRGAQVKLADLPQEHKRRYWDRVEYELAVIREAGLADYFLIEWDVCNFVDQHKGPRGKGRGSGAGSLVNYLLNITDIDPIRYGLYFERFYNASRNIPPHFEGSTFMKWYGDNFMDIIKVAPDDARLEVRRAVACQMARIKNLDMLKAEAAWIDEHSPRTWQFLASLLGSTDKIENPANSHVMHAMGVTDQLDESKPANLNPGHVSLPDIDTDIGVVFRAKVIEHVTQRWGEEKVAQMITFGRLQGKAALKEVFRAQPDTVKHLMAVRAIKLGQNPKDIHQKPMDLCNEITQYIPDEAMIADDLRQAREETGDDNYGILQWAIDHIEPVGEAYKWFRPLFDQAMRIEGTKKSQSKHAAGLVIADRPISELVPMAYDAKSKLRVCGLEMATAEAMGAVKFDFLGVVALDKLWHGQSLVNHHNPPVVIDGQREE
jgi:DNA polymerase III alpha subunit